MLFIKTGGRSRFSCFFVFVFKLVLGMELRTLQILDKLSATELYSPAPLVVNT